MPRSVQETLDDMWTEINTEFLRSIDLRRPFVACPAGNEDNHRWFVADRMGINRTVNLLPILRGQLPFVSKELAEELASKANAARNQTARQWAQQEIETP